MRIVTFLLSFLFLTQSCTTYQATSEKYHKLPYNKLKVYPEWVYKYNKAGNYILPIAGAIGGGIYGYQNEFTYDKKTYSGIENSAIFSGVGLLSGVLITGLFTPKKRKKDFQLSESEKWVKKYNKQNKFEYTIYSKDIDKSLILVPQKDLILVRRKIQKFYELLDSSSKMSFAQINDFEHKLDNEYSIISNNEIEKIKSIISQNRTKIANYEILEKCSNLIKRETTLEQAELALSFSDNFKDLYKYCDENTRNEIETKLSNKIEEILNYFLIFEKDKFYTQYFNLDQIDDLNIYIDKRVNRYSAFTEFNERDAIINFFLNRKTFLITSNKSELQKKLNSIITLEELNALFYSIFSKTNNQDKALQNLKLDFEQKISTIEINKAKVEAEKREKQRIAEVKRLKLLEEESERKKERLKEIANLRLNLIGNYGSNLFNPEEIALILGQYNSLFTVNNKYDRSEAELFFSRLQRRGFYRENKNNLSDFEKFVNRYGHILLIIGGDNLSTSKISFTIPKPSQEILNLYSLDLETNYRRGFTAENDEIIKAPQKSFEYIKSGTYVYSYEINSKNEFELTAWDNSNNWYPVHAEELSVNSFKVTAETDYTKMKLKEGEKIKFKSTGSVSLGVFAGTTDPRGIRGYDIYSFDSNFKHGCLLGRVGKGDWFYIGDSSTYTVTKSGFLQLRINDLDQANNSGYFKVETIKLE